METGYLKKSVIKNSVLWVIIFGLISGGLGYFIYQGLEYAQSVFGTPVVLSEDTNNYEYFSKSFAPIANVDNLIVSNTGYYLWEQKDNGPQKKTDGIFITVAEGYWVICVYPSKAEMDPDVLDTTDCIAYLDKPSSIEDYPGLIEGLLTDLNDAYAEDGYEFTEEDFAPNVLYIVPKSTLLIRKFAAICIGLVELVMVLLLLKNIVDLIFPKGTKGISALKQYGDIDQVIEQIELEQPIYKNKGQVITKNWLISTSLSTNAIKLDDIIWVYSKIRGINNIGVYSLKVHTRKGKTYYFNTVTEKNHLAFLEELRSVLPWIYYGDTPANHKLWKNNRQVMLDEIEANKKIISLNNNEAAY